MMDFERAYGGPGRGASEQLRGHVKGCPQCAETQRVALWMQGLARHLSVAATPPDPMVILLRARLAERRHVERQTLRRTLIASACAQLAAGLALSFLLLRLVPAIDAGVGWLNGLASLDWLPASDEGRSPL